MTFSVALWILMRFIITQLLAPSTSRNELKIKGVERRSIIRILFHSFITLETLPSFHFFQSIHVYIYIHYPFWIEEEASTWRLLVWFTCHIYGMKYTGSKLRYIYGSDKWRVRSLIFHKLVKGNLLLTVRRWKIDCCANLTLFASNSRVIYIGICKFDEIL